MTLSIIGIVLGSVAIGLFIWLRKDQNMTSDLTDSDVRAMENCYKALMEDFNNYQVETDRKIADLEKQLEIKNNKAHRRMDKMNKSLPSIIGQVVGQIEFAQDTINRKR
jgi:hypothetical protein